MYFIKNAIIIIIALNYTFNNFAKEILDFPKIWEMVYTHNPLFEIIDYEIQSSFEKAKRNSRHYLPIITLDSKIYFSNDPANQFFQYLNQAKVKSSDFQISNLNSPSDNYFYNTEIEAYLPIYHGGYFSALQHASEYSNIALKNKNEYKKIKKYNEILFNYANLILLNDLEFSIINIEKYTNKKISNYNIGKKSNLLGYSGLLTLKSIKNKLDILLKEISTDIKNTKNYLNIMSGIQSIEWETSSISFENLIKIYSNPTKMEKYSYQAKAEISHANALKEQSIVERSQYLPKIGFFAKENLFYGSRGFNSTYFAGINFKIDFSPTSYGSDNEYNILSNSHKKAAEEILLNDNYLIKKSTENIDLLYKKIDIINNEENILNEQIEVLEKLYKNGNINIIQIAELINKKSDIIKFKANIRQKLLLLKLDIFLCSQMNVEPKNIWGLH